MGDSTGDSSTSFAYLAAQITNMSKEPLKRLTAPDWVFKGELSNLTRHFSYRSLGVQKLISNKLYKANFPEQFARDISRIHDLTKTQEIILSILIRKHKFAKEFSLTDENEIYLSDSTRLSRSTVRYSFYSLCWAKKLLIKTGKKLYALNREYVFHLNDIKDANFANVVLSYEFSDTPEPSPEIAEDEK
jgi:hypothetical protein